MRIADQTPVADRLPWSFLAALLLLAAGHILPTRAAEPDAAKLDPAALEFFEKNVRPVLVAHCYECHAAGEKNGGLLLDSREGVLQGGDSGAAIVPGRPEQSRMIEAIRYTNRDLQMPPKKQLSPDQIAVLEKWVAMGAPDPRHSTGKAAATGPMGMSIDEGREFWSIKPVADPRVPPVSNVEWVRTPIDAFLLAKLDEQGLRPAPPADKRTLIRRVTFDLIGLPPTPEEIEAYLADETPQAFQKVVERLLQSPHYGVRWGRHWLDVARYADSNGLDENLAFGNAWRYRDYVVDAFNRDLPFDRFVIEQLAGDLVPEANPRTKTATGFLVLGAKVLAEPDREKLEMDTIDEQLDTIGKVFLGATLGCVRCHDHKFDPFKQTDYYALAAIFKSTRTFADSNTGAIKHWNEHSFATEDEQARMKQVEAEIAAKKNAAAAFKNEAVTKLRNTARAKATDYLVAAAGFDSDMPLTQVEAIAKPLGLHPRILHHCRLHLSYHSDDPFFGKWHELAAVGDKAGIEQHYRPLFEGAEAALAEAKKKNGSAKTLDDAGLEAARSALYDLSGFLAVPPKPEFALDAATLAEFHRLSEEARIVESGAPDLSSAMGVAEGTVFTSLPIHVRGSHRNLGEPVSRDFPEVLRTSNVKLILPRNQSGRFEFAQWIASSQHPLTARVYVNRIWRWHFGAGLVGSTDNFGRLGDRPSHPELLDWLARSFMESGWSTKDLHRLILASSAYQMASTHPAEESGNGPEPATFRERTVDPENHLLWKFHRERLDAEQIRDSLLAVSGRLDPSIGGKSIPLRNRQFVFDHTSIDHTRYDSLRRAVYLPIVRNNLYTLFEQFDFPDPTMPTGSRNSTVVAPQALLLMNAELVLDSAEQMARQLLEQAADDEVRVRLAYERAVGRPPTEVEIRRVLAFVDDVSSPVAASVMGSGNVDRPRAWALFCQSLLASNEFVFLR